MLYDLKRQKVCQIYVAFGAFIKYCNCANLQTLKFTNKMQSFYGDLDNFIEVYKCFKIYNFFFTVENT